MARRKDRPGPLEPRSAAILRAIIEEYVATAQPVGSQALVVKYRLGVSPATVRNVMAELERAGYLRSPHTSAGRVPTDRGYRLYVESISDGRRPGARRAAHDPPPVRAGRVRQRAVVPPGRLDARRRHPLRRHRHARQARRLAAASPRPGRGRRPRWRASSWSSPRAPSSRSWCRSTRAPTRPSLDDIAARPQRAAGRPGRRAR